MRLFLAVPLEEPSRAALAAVQERLKAAEADVRWVEPENFHLTVAFLGDQTNGLLPDIEGVTSQVAADAKAFRIRVGGVSFFPKRGPLKTLWVGLLDGADEWRTVTQAAEEAFAPFGVPPGNKLVPHITLGRVKSEQGMDRLRAALAADAGADCGTQRADRLQLVQSFLNPAGAAYGTLGKWILK